MYKQKKPSALMRVSKEFEIIIKREAEKTGDNITNITRKIAKNYNYDPFETIRNNFNTFLIKKKNRGGKI